MDIESPSDDSLQPLARALNPYHWAIHDMLITLEETTNYVAPYDALARLTLPSIGDARKIHNISTLDSPTDFHTSRGRSVTYIPAEGEDKVEKIARLIAPADWDIYDILTGWGKRTGNVTPDTILNILTSPSRLQADHLYHLARYNNKLSTH